MEVADPDTLAFLNNNKIYLTIEVSWSVTILLLKSMTRILQISERGGSTLYMQAQIHYMSGLLSEGDKI